MMPACDGLLHLAAEACSQYGQNRARWTGASQSIWRAKKADKASFAFPRSPLSSLTTSYLPHNYTRATLRVSCPSKVARTAAQGLPLTDPSGSRCPCHQRAGAAQSLQRWHQGCTQHIDTRTQLQAHSVSAKGRAQDALECPSKDDCCAYPPGHWSWPPHLGPEQSHDP